MVKTLTKEEMVAVLASIDTADPYQTLGGKCKRKNMFRTYLNDGFMLFLLTGGRREEVVDLKWSDIFISVKGVRFFQIPNLKSNRAQKVEHFYKYIPINSDLYTFLESKGMSSKTGSKEFILYPERTVKTKTIMDDLSKAFTHYLKAAKVDKKVSLKNLRKTYITWVNQVMEKDTGILTSHATQQVLVSHYIDPTILSAIEKAAQEIKIFGT